MSILQARRGCVCRESQGLCREIAIMLVKFNYTERQLWDIGMKNQAVAGLKAREAQLFAPPPPRTPWDDIELATPELPKPKPAPKLSYAELCAAPCPDCNHRNSYHYTAIGFGICCIECGPCRQGHR